MIGRRRDPKPRDWYSDYHDSALHPTVTVLEQDRERPTLVLPNGTVLVAKPPVGFRFR